MGKEKVYFSEDCTSAWVLPPPSGRLEVTGHAPNATNLKFCETVAAMQEQKKKFCSKPAPTSDFGKAPSVDEWLGRIEASREESNCDEDALSELERLQYKAIKQELDTLIRLPGASVQVALEVDWLTLIRTLSQKNKTISFHPMPLSQFHLTDGAVDIPAIDGLAMENRMSSYIQIPLGKACAMRDKTGAFDPMALRNFATKQPLNLVYKYTVKNPISYKAQIKGRDIFTNTDGQVKLTLFFFTLNIPFSTNFRDANSTFEFEVTTPAVNYSYEDYVNLMNLAKLNLLTRYLNYTQWYPAFFAPAGENWDEISPTLFKVDEYLKLLSSAVGTSTTFGKQLSALVTDLSQLSMMINIGITAATSRYLNDYTFTDSSSQDNTIALPQNIAFYADGGEQR
ncbi:hypothetical protein [Oligoflexus tunisiensis]|uniref:hypothetical protein n=1 Tax=Oligoflexus tunisiensis TaxID=708132 RepID=UPI00114CAE9B|nr:hypothetical protein [Oligoflexus tunisiensis]